MAVFSSHRTLVAGGTGYLGGHVLNALVPKDTSVRALVRTDKQALNLAAKCDDAFIGQVTDAGSLAGVMDGIDAIFSSIGITRQKDGLTYDDVDYQGNLNLLKEAERAGVKRFVYVATYRGREFRDVEIIAAKERFVDALKASTIQSCVIRPTGFFSDMSDFFNMAKSGRIYLFGNGRSKMNPISGADLSQVCADAILSDTDDIDVGGPDVLSQNDMADLAFEALGRPVRITHIPMQFAQFGLGLMKRITAQGAYGPLEMYLSMSNSDMSAPRHGKEHLADHFKALATTVK